VLVLPIVLWGHVWSFLDTRAHVTLLPRVSRAWGRLGDQRGAWPSHVTLDFSVPVPESLWAVLARVQPSWLQGNSVNARDLCRHLPSLRALRHLGLSSKGITDADLVHLAALPLQTLNLTRISRMPAWCTWPLCHSRP
jgi:hypothetical protein